MARGKKGGGPGQGPARGLPPSAPRHILDTSPDKQRERALKGAEARRRQHFDAEAREEMQAKARELAEAEGINFVQAFIRVKRQYLGIAPNAPSPNSREVKDAAAMNSIDAVEVLYEVLRDTKVSANARIQAASQIIEIAFGKTKATEDADAGAKRIIIENAPE